MGCARPPACVCFTFTTSLFRRFFFLFLVSSFCSRFNQPAAGPPCREEAGSRSPKASERNHRPIPGNPARPQWSVVGPVRFTDPRNSPALFALDCLSAALAQDRGPHISFHASHDPLSVAVAQSEGAVEGAGTEGRYHFQQIHAKREEIKKKNSLLL